MARSHAPTTCTEDDCNHDLHERTHERNPQYPTRAHPDAPEVERVCTIHGVVYSR